MKKELTPTIDEQVRSLMLLPDSKIDTADIPEVDFSHALRGHFYRPIKQSVTLRLDKDVLEWFKQNNPKYQTAINDALRQYALEHHAELQL